jgi:hypothetical protein
MNGHRSFFFPLLLIGAGVIWLMVNLGYVPSTNLWALAHIWPIFLIGAGLGLILRQYWSEAGIVVSTLIVLGAILAVVYAPQLGWANMPSWGWWDFGFNGSIAGSRVIETKARDASGFTAIDIRFPAEVSIVQGADEGVTITADDNLLPQLQTQVNGSTLVIRNSESNWRQRVNASQTVEISITVENLNSIRLETAGTISVAGVSGDNLEIRLNGAGSIELVDIDVVEMELHLEGAGSVKASGTADSLFVEIDGMSSLDADELQTQTAEIHISGLGSADIRVAEVLTVEIDGAGSVNYYGSPRVERQVDGLGSVNQVEE